MPRDLLQGSFVAVKQVIKAIQISVYSFKISVWLAKYHLQKNTAKGKVVGYYRTLLRLSQTMMKFKTLALKSEN